MGTLHIWPQDQFGHPSERWNWSLSAFGLVGEHSTLGYSTTGMALDHARWMGMEFEQVQIHTLTSSQEQAQRAQLLAEHERQQHEVNLDRQAFEATLAIQTVQMKGKHK